MTDGAENPAPTAPPAPPATNTDHETRLQALEQGFKDLAELGRAAYDGLHERIANLERGNGTSLPPASPAKKGLSKEEVAATSGWVKRE
jgi:hypothetical protein